MPGTKTGYDQPIFFCGIRQEKAQAIGGNYPIIVVKTVVETVATGSCGSTVGQAFCF
jgi:hypothetical protein